MRRLVAIGAEAHAHVDHLLRRLGRLQFIADLGGEGLGQADEDFPVVQRPGRLVQHRLVEAGDVAHGEGIEGAVVVLVLQRRGGRQDQVGVAGGFIYIEIDAEHELQPVQGLLQLATVGSGQHRVAGHGDQRAHLAFAGGEHLFGQGRHR